MREFFVMAEAAYTPHPAIRDFFRTSRLPVAVTSTRRFTTRPSL
jgi:hypothetical protein